MSPVHRLSPGEEAKLNRLGAAPDSSGLLVTEGFLTRDVIFAGRRSRELLGAGDLLRPGDIEPDFIPPFSQADFTLMEQTSVAVLDKRVLRYGARWPDFVEELLRRTLHRSRWLAIRLAISGAMRVDERLLLFLWLAAGRWGRVTRDGVVVPLDVTHEVLGELIGAQRPTVTTALNDLRRARRLDCPQGHFLLLGDPPSASEFD